ncbi:periplasmic binding protein/LacI transcriptional regulator, putative [Microseira wollei NIES-4236]|uniref:Periplasmic binding protein/LacI transcriptional regulator, putative n=2 Tax=Microseira wollei TaxID=467598 RepID=A0AAV3XBF9_9CYAN|nr:periplasmic binding protein/LacI transcriptional regulator, putative [Microseira wollei NIES-4236]
MIMGKEKTEDETETKVEATPEEQAEISELESVLQNLDASFKRVDKIEDPVKKEYKLLQEAKRMEMPAESYRRMFENYYLERLPKKPENQWLNPLKFLDQRLGDFVKWCENISLYSLATVIGQFTLLAAMGAYFMEAPQRQQELLDSARQEIRNQKGVEYSESRIEALETLNKYCESLLGEQAPNANLEDIKLNKCYKFQLGLATFAKWPPQFYRYEGINLSQMNLAGANLKGANLSGANLEGTNLEGANLERANLKGANLKGANLKGAVLRAASLEGANLEEANLDSTRMSRVYLRGANLKKASITGARLLWADLQGATLTLANLTESNLNRANLQGADLYKANFKGASLRYADLRNGTIIIGADFERANLKRAKFWSADQVKRSYNWEKAFKDDDWSEKIAKPGADKYKVGLLIANNTAIFKLYQQGMESAAKENPQIEIISLKTGETIEEEAQGIKQLLAEDVDVILVRPLDPEESISAIQKAYISGVVPLNIGDCLSKEGQKVAFACYESDSFKMGYDLGKYLGNWAKKNRRGQQLNVGLVDGADSSRLYPYFQGFQAGMKDSGVSWNQTASTNAQTEEDLPKVKEMLKANPNINILWAGAPVNTSMSVKAVEDLKLENKVSVFGIIPLTRTWANALLNPNHPLQSIVDESPAYVGYKAALHGIDVIQGKTSREYQYTAYQHRLLTQNDSKTVNQLLSQTLDVEKNELKPPLELKKDAGIPSEILSSLNTSIASPLPAITDKATIEKLQEELQKLIVQNSQTSTTTEDNQTPATFSDTLVYRVLVTKEVEIVSYEPIGKLSVDFVEKTPLPKLSVKDKETNQPPKEIKGPVAEYKVLIAPNGTVEVKWGESFIQGE